MEKICSAFPFKVDRNVQIAAGVLTGLLATGYIAVKVTAKIRLSKARKEWNEAGKNVVVLHMFDRPKHTINLSPFPAKLETFLRINKIKYVPEFKYAMSSKGKSPWITVNGVDVADSQLAMDYLSNLFNINMNAHLNKTEVAIARAMRSVLEDHLYFAFVVEKWVVGRGLCMLEQMDIPGGRFTKFLMVHLFLERAAKQLTIQTWMQGMGRHDIKDVRKMMTQDMECISDFLGDKPYMMGDRVSEVDCVAFGFLSVGKFAPITEKDMLVEYPNLSNYVDRMKNEFYPDWDDLLAKKK